MYVTAYASTKINLISGGPIDFTSQGSKPYPVVVWWYPAAGTTGSTVIVNGLNFGNDIKNLSVSLHGQECQVAYITLKQLSIIIPKYSESFKDKLLVVYNGMEGRYSRDFSYKASLKPKP